MPTHLSSAHRTAQVFWVSENRLFHAYALNKYLTLAKSVNKNMSDEEYRYPPPPPVSLCVVHRKFDGRRHFSLLMSQENYAAQIVMCDSERYEAKRTRRAGGDDKIIRASDA